MFTTHDTRVSLGTQPRVVGREKSSASSNFLQVLGLVSFTLELLDDGQLMLGLHRIRAFALSRATEAPIRSEDELLEAWGSYHDMLRS